MTKAYAVVYEEESVKHVNAFNDLQSQFFCRVKYIQEESFMFPFFLVIFVNKS